VDANQGQQASRRERGHGETGHAVGDLAGGAVLPRDSALNLKDLCTRSAGGEVCAEFGTAAQVTDFQASMVFIQAAGGAFRSKLRTGVKSRVKYIPRDDNRAVG